MKKITLLVVSLISTVLLASCTLSSNLEYDIVTTLFPQYDIARTLGEDDFNVYNVLPLGASPHTYEITSQDMERISNASVFLYTSDDVEPWAKNLLLDNTLSINLLERIEESVELHIEHEDEVVDDHDDHDDHDHEGEDPHYWSHPLALIEMVDIIKDEMIAIRADLTSEIQSRATELKNELQSEFDLLETELERLSLTEPTLYIAGHNALAYYAEYFNIHIESLFPDFIPDAELTSAQIETFMSIIKTNQVSYFFVEPYFDNQPLAAELIKDALEQEGYTVSFEQIYQLHNIGSVELQNEDTLLSLLALNRINIISSLEQNHA